MGSRRRTGLRRKQQTAPASSLKRIEEELHRKRRSEARQKPTLQPRAATARLSHAAWPIGSTSSTMNVRKIDEQTQGTDLTLGTA